MEKEIALGRIHVEKKAVKSPYSSSLYFSSGAFFRQIEKVAIECWKPSGLHPSHGHLLLLILNSEFQNPTFYTSDLLLSPSTISRLLGKLEKKGLIKRMPFSQLSVTRPTIEGYKMRPLLEDCERDFRGRCDKLLGKEAAYQMSVGMNLATDALSKFNQKENPPPGRGNCRTADWKSCEE